MDLKRGKGYGYKSTSGKICMIRCFECGTENYAMAVARGLCAFCGYDPNIKTKTARTKSQPS